MTDAGGRVTAFRSKRELLPFLRVRLWMLLIYKFVGNGYAPTIMTMARALAELT